MKKLYGTSKSDKLVAGSGDYYIDGRGGNDYIYGGSGNDVLLGGAGNDHLFFGKGQDTLVGGSGNDTFHFAGPVKVASNTFYSGTSGGWGSSTPALPKPAGIITDFGNGDDKLDFAAIDANTKVKGNQEFKFMGTMNFSKHAGELRYEQINKAGTANDKTMVYGDVNGDGRADFSVQLTGLHVLDRGDIWF